MISEKLSTRNPDDFDKQFQFANSLVALGGLNVRAEKEKDAEDVLIRAVAVSQHRADEVFHPLLATSLLLLGTHHLSSDREHEAEDALTRSISASQELVRQTPAELTRHHLPANVSDLLGGAFYVLGTPHLLSDALTRAVAAFQDRRRIETLERLSYWTWGPKEYDRDRTGNDPFLLTKVTEAGNEVRGSVRLELAAHEVSGLLSADATKAFGRAMRVRHGVNNSHLSSCQTRAEDPGLEAGTLYT